jgi:uncharacterized phiE125 gp8 family phage protein
MPPASEPLTLAEAKAFLRVEHGDDDDVIGALIAGSRIHIESQTRRVLIAQTWRLSFDCWPAGGSIVIVPSPLRQVTAARVFRQDNTSAAIDVEVFGAELGADPSLLRFSPGSLPGPGRPFSGIEIDVEVGYGEAGDIPEPLRQAMRLLIVHWYENRGAMAVGQTVSVLPHAVMTLLAPYRILSL